MMHKSHTYEWFCAPGSHMSSILVPIFTGIVSNFVLFKIFVIQMTKSFLILDVNK